MPFIEPMSTVSKKRKRVDATETSKKEIRVESSKSFLLPSIHIITASHMPVRDFPDGYCISDPTEV